MTSPNVELVRSLFSAWEHGDYSSADWADPQIEFAVRDGPAPATGIGHDGMRAVYRELMNVWEDYHATPESYRELEGGRVLVFIRLGGRGKVSGLELGQTHSEAATLFAVRGDKVTSCALYWDRSNALADAGVEAGGSMTPWQPALSG